MNNCCNGLIDTLEVILALQLAAEEKEEIIEGCDRPFLGCCPRPICCNTRPVTIYTNENILWSMPYTLNGNTGTSNVFRVEKINDCSVTFRVLAPAPVTDSDHEYVKTEDFFTISACCLCCIKCLPDTCVECVGVM